MGFDFAAVQAPFRMQPGLRRLAPPAKSLTASTPGSRHLREKLAVLHAFPAQALCSIDAFDPASVLTTLAREAEHERPSPWTFAGPNDCAAARLGWSLRDGVACADDLGTGEPAIGALLEALPRHQRATALCSLAFVEDFALVEADGGTIPWLAVCLPSRWAPEEKVGHHFNTVHAPVADNAALLAASRGLMSLVTDGERWERFVWTLSADPRLHQHPRRAAVEWPLNAVASAAFLRSERQAFVPIEGTRQAVFTIKVESEPMTTAVQTSAEAALLHDALASMSTAVLAYRGLSGPRDALLRWLNDFAGAAARAE